MIQNFKDFYQLYLSTSEPFISLAQGWLRLKFCCNIINWPSVLLSMCKSLYGILNFTFLFVMLQFQINIFRVFCSAMLSRVSTLPKEKQRSMQGECNFFKYMLGKQQIQQMSLLDEENGAAFFYKLKVLFFDENQDDDHMLSVIRSEPIKIIGNMLFVLTKSYNQKLTEIIEPLEEEKYRLMERLSETKQQLQYSMDDNEYFKAIINKLEEEKKQTEEKLNQSVQQFERSRDQIDYEIHKMEKIQNEVNKIYADAEEIYTENSQLKQMLLECEQRIATFEEENQGLKQKNQELFVIREEFTSKYNDVLKNLALVEKQNEEMQARLQDRQEFIASFINDYNKVRLINQNESSSRQYLGMQKIEDQQSYNQLQGFNFNNFEQHSNKSQKSLSKDNSLRNLDNQVDQKFQFVNATAEKLKPKIPLSHPCATEEKVNRKMESKGSSNHKQIHSRNRNASNKVQFAKAESNKRVNKTLVKTVSSKNFQQKESIMVTPSQGDESKMMEEMLKKKLHQKNQKINRLEMEVANLSDRLLDQKNEMTIMEGQYEIQIEQLKEKLAFTKKQLLTIYAKYTMANAECSAYGQKLAQLEQQLATMEQEHRVYCQQLKIRCKAYVLKRIDQVQSQFQSMKISLNNQQNSFQQGESENQQLQYSAHTQQQLPQEFHLQFQETPVERRQQSCKIDDFSEIHSYERLPNHQLNGFDFQFSTKFSNVDHNNENQKIYEQENYEIKTNLAILTERCINDKVEIRDMRRATLTDRCSNLKIQAKKLENQQKNQKSLRIQKKVSDYNLQMRKQRKLVRTMVLNEQQMLARPRQMGLFTVIQLIHIQESQQNRLKLWQSTWSFHLVPQRQRQFQTFKAEHFTFYPLPKREMDILSVLDYSFIPQQSHLGHFSSLIDFNFAPEQKKLSLEANLYEFSRPMKRFSELHICRMQSFTYDIKVQREMSISHQIGLNERITKMPQLHSINWFEYIHIKRQPRRLDTQSNTCNYHTNNQINRRQGYAQTITKLFTDVSAQMIVETWSFDTQTQNECIDSGSQTHSCCLQASIQTECLMKSSQAQTFIGTFSSETQTNVTNVIDQAIQTQIKTFSEVQTETESILSNLKMTNTIDILVNLQENEYSNRFQSQVLNYTYIPQKRVLKMAQNLYEILVFQYKQPLLSIYCVVNEKMEARRQRNFIIADQVNICQQAIKSLKNNELCPSDFIHIQASFRPHTEQPAKKQTLFSMGRQVCESFISELPQRSSQHTFGMIKIPSFHTQIHFGCEENSDISCYDSLISNKVIEENLSTKNDEVAQTRQENQYVAIYQRLEVEDNQEQRSFERKSAETPRFTEQNISQMDNSNLNKAILMSDNNSLKIQGKTCNPESKSYKTQYRSTNQISISPWLFDEVAQIMQECSSKTLEVPIELSSRLSKQREHCLLKYLRRHKIVLNFDEEVTKAHFKKPNQLKKKIHFAFVKNDKENEIFMITKTKIYNLRNNRHIILEPNREIDERNFIFGQSEVIITGDRMLIIKRKGKEMRLSGNLQDGKWEIQSYITCSYERSKQGSY